MGNKTGGRFIFFNKGFLEPEIYSKGRGITGMGKIKGTQISKVGERPYEFPVIDAEELKLLDKVERNPYFYPPTGILGIVRVYMHLTGLTTNDRCFIMILFHVLIPLLLFF
jgi:starvation-inducible outer membrane lipoprotein